MEPSARLPVSAPLTKPTASRLAISMAMASLTLLGPIPAARRSPSFSAMVTGDRKSTRLNSSHLGISYAVFCLEQPDETDSTPVYAGLIFVAFLQFGHFNVL